MNMVMPKDEQQTLLDRTLSNLRTAWAGLSDSTWYYLSRAPRPDLPDDDIDKIRSQMEACLDARGDEVGARARAADLGQGYLALNEVGRARFLKLLAAEYDVDRAVVDAAVDAVRDAADESARAFAEAKLRDALDPRWRQLLTRFTTLPEGMKFLVDLRAELLVFARSEPSLKRLAADLRVLLSAWFDVGLLELREITWGSPAALLEKLIAYEAVHAIKSWDDLKNRLASDRRCFAFFHPNMADEPLIFVEVALVPGMAASVDELLDESIPAIDPASANTAIFYSISNAQSGLAGISFGNFLIKQVVELLGQEFPNLKTFATLSPIPGFRSWFDGEIEEGRVGLTSAERKALQPFSDAEEDGAMVSDLLARDGWQGDEALSEALKAPVIRQIARYIATAKRPDGRTRDPVAHFHLSNGARAERLNWLGDRSAKGLKQSAGAMINYLYRLSDIEANSEGYSSARKIALSSTLRSLARD